MKKLLLLLVLVSLQVFAGVPLSTNFTLNTALPLDDRAQVTNLTARNALPALRRWEGMLVYVKSEKKHFTLVDGIADINWTELSGSGGGGISEWEPSTDYKAKDLVLQNGEIFQAINDFTSGVSFDPADFTPISKYVTADVVPDPGKITFWKSNDPYGLLDSGAANLDTSGNLSGLNNVTILGDTTLKTSLTGVVKAVSGLLSASALDLSTDVVGTLPIANGGTGATSKSWVDLTTNQGAIAGNKAFTGNLSTSGTMLASNLSGTNTGDLITGGATGSTTVTNTLKTPFRQVTPTATGVVDIETGNPNELINPRFQATTYNDGWTCSLGTMSQGVGPDGSKALSVVSTGGGFRCRQTFTSSADLKGTLARFYARIKTAAPDVKVCGLDGGILTANEVGCVTVNPTNANKVFDDPSGFFRYGDTLYGIVIYTNNAAVFPTVIDDVSMGAAGLTTAPISTDSGWRLVSGTPSWTNSSLVLYEKIVGDTVTYSGRLSLTGVPSAGSLYITLNRTIDTGISKGFSVPRASMNDSGADYSVVAEISNSNPDRLTFYYYSLGGPERALSSVTNTAPFSPGSGDFVSFTTLPMKILGAPAIDTSAILSSNADFGMTPVTVTGSWNTNTTYSAIWSRKGERAYFEVLVTNTGAPNSTGLTINLPITIDTAKTIATVSSKSIFGDAKHSDATGAGRIIGDVGFNSSTSVAVFHLTNGSNSETNTNQVAPFAFATGDTITLRFDVPVLGWTQSPIAIIPLYTPLVHARAFAGSNVSVTSAVTPMVNIAEDATGIFSNAATLITATIKQAGLYNICFYASTDVANNIGIVISGTIYQFDTYATNARGSGCWVQRLAIGETVRPYLPSSGTMYGGVDDNGFSVTRIGD